MQKRLLSAAICAAALAATPAAAGWRFAQWGMTPDQVKEAGGDQVVQWKKKDPETLAIKTPFEVGGIKFDDAIFLFDGGKLSEVVLHTKIWNQDKVREVLAGSFGQATYKDRSGIGTVPVTTDTYQDREKGNAITLWCLGDCSVKYKPLDQGF